MYTTSRSAYREGLEEGGACALHKLGMEGTPHLATTGWVSGGSRIAPGPDGLGEEGGFEEGHHNLVHAGEVPHALHNLSGAIFSCLLKKSIRAKVMASKLAQ